MSAFHSPWMSDLASSEEDWQNEWRLDQKYDNYVRLSTSSYIPWQRFIKRQAKITSQHHFPEYAETLKERLASHGFERPFQLDQDAARQDQMTTWIEYLGYEYWWYDYYAGIASRHQKRHDNAWKKLVDSKVLRPGETEEFICDFDAIVQRSGQKESAERAAKCAKLAVSSAETTMAKWRQSKLSPQTLRQRLLAARSKLDMAQAEYESLKRHSDCIHEFILRTEAFRIAKRDAERHQVLLRWMLHQVPLIEAELSSSNERGPDNRGEKNALKRNRNRLEEVDENSQEQSRGEGVNNPHADRQAPATAGSQEPSPKRLRCSARLPSNLTSGTLAPKKDCEPWKANGEDSSHRSRTFKPSRRSARMAERAERLSTTITTTTLAQTP